MKFTKAEIRAIDRLKAQRKKLTAEFNAMGRKLTDIRRKITSVERTIRLIHARFKQRHDARDGLPTQSSRFPSFKYSERID